MRAGAAHRASGAAGRGGGPRGCGARGCGARGGALAVALVLFALALAAGCSSVPTSPRAPSSGPRCAACYLDDGPGDAPPANLAAIPDAVPRAEPLHPGANRPYTVFGRGYVPRVDVREHRERGYASWYGRKFHGRPTSSGEPYDMYGMTAAHPTLPIPSYVRVTHLRNGRSVVVRVNDRGPFLNRRVIDLSYTAAHRLGFVEAGSAEVEIELLAAPGLPPAGPAQTAARGAVAGAGAVAGTGGVAGTGATIPPAAATAIPAATAATVAPRVSAPSPVLPPAPIERLSIETTIEDRPAMPARPDAAPLATAAATPAATPAAVPGVWLQFGAYASRANAEQARARLQRELPWLPVPAELVESGDTWRVQVGPWDRREDAVAVAERIAASGSARPVAVVR